MPNIRANGVVPGTNSAVATATGILEAYLGPPNAGDFWYVQRYSVGSDSGNAPVCTVYMSSVDNYSIVDFTNSGKKDIGDQLQEIELSYSDRLIFQWTNLILGSRAFFWAQYRLVRR